MKLTAPQSPFNKKWRRLQLGQNIILVSFVIFCLESSSADRRFLLFKNPSATSAVPNLPNFPRYLAPDFTHYISERLEMTTQ